MSEASITTGDIPRVREGIDLTRSGLSLQEGFLVSRVDGRTPVGALASLVGKGVDETRRVVQRLVTAGVLVVGGPSPAPVQPADPYEGFAFPAEALAEPVELSDQEKRRILFTHGKLSEWTHYRLLGVRWRDDAKAIRRAFQNRSKEWHPDQFFRRELGSYRSRIDEIFRAVRKAYDELSDPAAKAAYDEEHAPRFDEEDIAEMLTEQRRQEREIRREEEKKLARLERNPIRQKMLRARAQYEEALALREKGELLEALHQVQAAIMFHDREEYRALHEELKTETSEQRIAPFLRRGQSFETMSSWDEAISMYLEAVRLAPDHGPARLRLAYNLLMAGREVGSSQEHVQKALQRLPEDPEAHFVRGLWYEKAGNDKLAIQAYQRALKLKPNYAEAKKRLKKLRWGF